MDERFEDGNAFAIPALWKPSTFAHYDERATHSTAFAFEPLGISRHSRFDEQRPGADTLRQICRMKIMNDLTYSKT